MARETAADSPVDAPAKAGAVASTAVQICAVACAMLSSAAYSEPNARPSREAMWLGFIHQVNQNEIALAKLAQQNAGSTQVKAFANRMISDHTQADQQAVALADRQHVTLPSAATIKAARAESREELIEENSKVIGSTDGEYALYEVGTGGAGSAGFDFQATLDKLRGLKGPDFDQEYLSAMMDDHLFVVDRLKYGLTQITEPDQLKLINQLLPTMRQHLTAARQLSESLNN